MKVLAFGIIKDIFGSSSVDIELPEQATTDVVKRLLEERYPRLSQLASYVVAVNNEYAVGESLIAEQDEVAIIPPVSGG